MIGEWSAALPAVQMDTLAIDQGKSLTGLYAAAQLSAFRGQQAGVFWTYKTEGSMVWDFRSLVEAGLL